MKRTLVVFAMLLFFAIEAHAASVAVLRANQNSFGREYFFGFSAISSARMAAFNWQNSSSKGILNRLKKMAPDLIFTIGDLPAEALAKELPSTPFLLANYVPSNAKMPSNVFVLETTEPVRIGLELFKELFPNRKRIGAMFDPRWSQKYFNRLKKEAAKRDIQPAIVKVSSPQDVETFVKALEGEVDLLFWISDQTTRHPRSQRAIFEFAKSQNLPVLSFDKSHVGKGAFFSIHVNAQKLGESAWRAASTILESGEMKRPALDTSPSAFEVSVSLKTSKDLGMNPEQTQDFFQKILDRGHSLEVLP